MTKIMNLKTIVVATVVVCVLATICGWCMASGTVCDSTEAVSKPEMTQTVRDERMGDDDLYMNIKPYYPDYMPYNMPISFFTYQTYNGGVSIPLHTGHRVTDDNNGTLSVVIVVLLVVSVLAFGVMLIYLFTYKPEEHYK